MRNIAVAYDPRLLKAGEIGYDFYSLKQLRCLFLITATTRRRDEKSASHTFSSFYVAHLAQPNESSRRRVVAVIKNDWAQPNPKWFKTRTNCPCIQGFLGPRTIVHSTHEFSINIHHSCGSTFIVAYCFLAYLPVPKRLQLAPKSRLKTSQKSSPK